MDIITTTASLLTLNGSARPATVALTPNDRRLIAAAPALYEALEATLGFLGWAADNGANKDAVKAVERMARAALALATGEREAVR